MTGTEHSAKTAANTAEAAARNNREYRTKVIHFATFEVDEYLSKKTGFAVGEEVYYIQRVRYFDDVPMILDNNWFLTRVVPGLTREIAEKSVYEYLEKVEKQYCRKKDICKSILSPHFLSPAIDEL